MLPWWKKPTQHSSNYVSPGSSGGKLNSTLSLKPSAELPKTGLWPKTVRQRNQRVGILGTTEVTTEPTTAPTTDCTSADVTAEDVISRLLELNWNWDLPDPLPFTQSFEQDVVRVWSAHAPPARRQPTAREHAVELLQLLQGQPRLVGKWVLSVDLEREVYPRLLACLGWAPRPWVGRNGVAKHLANLTRRSCKRVEVDGVTHNWAAFFVPCTRARRAGSVQSASSVRRSLAAS